MNFGLTSEQEEFRQEVRSFLESEATDELVAEFDRETVIGHGPGIKAFYKKLGERGWICPSLYILSSKLMDRVEALCLGIPQPPCSPNSEGFCLSVPL